MAGFFIEKLVVTGINKEPSSVEFCDGLNLIVGPSNTGKSYIVECIDYLFGFEPRKNKPFRFDPNLGYDTFKLFTRTPNGTVIFERKLGENKIKLSGSDPNFEHRAYSVGHNAKYSINSIWLQMIGVNEPHKILASKTTGRVQQLTWRAMLHMFFIKQEYISRASSVLLNPALMPNMAETPSKAIVLFLMNGMDADNNEVVEDRRIRAAKHGAVIDYIKSSVSRFSHRENEILGKQKILNAKSLLLTGYGFSDARLEVDSIINEIDDLQQKISDNIEQSKWLMSEIYANNEQLVVCDTLADRFAALRSQYRSDIKRLAFVIDGNLAHSSLPIPEHCPFCESEIPSSSSSLHIGTAKAELQHIRVHLKELEKAEYNLDAKRSTIASTVKELEHKKHNIDTYVSLELKPLLTQLKEKLIMYRRIVEINKELEFVQNEERMLNWELIERETMPEEQAPKHDLDRFFDSDTMRTFEEKLVSILKACHFEGAGSARLNINIFDLEVGARAKAISNGGGYCGFLNTVLALTLVEYLAEYGEYSPGLLVADSPLTQLSESEFKVETDTMTSGFLKYLLSIYENGLSYSNISGAADKQIIIIEQKEKLPMLKSIIKEEKHVKVIEFTRDKNHGRYGFLNGVFGH